MSNIKITKNGFYKLSSFKSDEIVIAGGIGAILFSDNSSSKKIILEENSKLEIYGVSQGTSDFDLEVISNGNNSSLKIRYLLLSVDLEVTKARIKSVLNSSFSSSDIKIVSIVKDDGEVDIDGVIKISENLSKVDANLLEENIFLGNNGKVKGTPTLLVSSNDVKASHACRVERISDDELFYLRSRGIKKHNAISFMIEAKILDLFNCLAMLDNDFYRNLVDDLINRLK